MITYEALEERNVPEALRFWASVPGVHLHENGEDTVEGVIAYMRRNPGFSFVAKDDGRMVGAILCGHDGRRGFVNHLGVLPSYRRRGIGTQLLSRTLDMLKAEGITKCALFVLKENTLGQSFYEALKWNEETIVKTYSKILK